MTSKHQQSGFTLLELIVVLIIIGVMAVSLLPRFFTNSGTSVYLYQDQLLSLLRGMQMQAMQCTDCTTPAVNITAASIIVAGSSCGDNSTQAICPSSRDGILFSSAASGIGFDSLGRPIGCGGACLVNVQGNATLGVCIETEGYIHPC